MVRIPTIQAEKLPAITGEPGAAGRPYREAAGLGREVRDLTLLLSQQANEVRKKREAQEMAFQISEFEVGVIQADEEMDIDLRKQGLSSEDYFSARQNGLTALINEKLIDIQNPEIRAKAKIVGNRILMQKTAEARTYELQLWKEQTRERLLRLLDIHAKQGNLEAGLNLIEESEPAIGADVAEKLRQTFVEKIGIADLRAEKPEVVLKNLEAGRYNFDSDTRKALIAEMRAEIGYREREEEKRLKRERERLEGEFFTKLMQGTLQPWEVISSELDLSTKNFFIQALEKKTNPVTDGPTFHRLFVGIEEGTVTPTDILAAHVADKLSIPHMSQLLTRLYQIRGGGKPESDWWFKLARKEAEQRLDYNAEIAQFQDPLGAELFFDGMATLMSTVEQEGLSGRQVFERSRDIFHPLYIDYAVNILGKQEEKFAYTDGTRIWVVPERDSRAFEQSHPEAKRMTIGR